MKKYANIQDEICHATSNPIYLMMADKSKLTEKDLEKISVISGHINFTGKCNASQIKVPFVST